MGMMKDRNTGIPMLFLYMITGAVEIPRLNNQTTWYFKLNSKMVSYYAHSNGHILYRTGQVSQTIMTTCTTRNIFIRLLFVVFRSHLQCHRGG